MSDGRHTVDLLERLLAFARVEPEELFAIATRVVMAHIRVRGFHVDWDDAAGVAAAIALPLLPLPPTASADTRAHLAEERARLRKRIARRRQRLPDERVDSPAELASLLAKLLLSDADRELKHLFVPDGRMVSETALAARPAPAGELEWLLRLRDAAGIPLSPASREALVAMIEHDGDYAAAAAALGIRPDALRARMHTLRSIILALEAAPPRRGGG